jgi:CBS domain-containing protein
MRVDQVMTKDVKTCRSQDTLNVPAQLMWDGDCGCIPVVDDGGRVAGMVTDRDICMAALTQDRPLTTMPVSIAMAKDVFACGPGDSVDDAETTMREHQVRRLPVLGSEGQLVGVLSLNDLARVAGKGRRSDGITVEAVEATLAAICAPRPLTIAAPA